MRVLKVWRCEGLPYRPGASSVRQREAWDYLTHGGGGGGAKIPYAAGVIFPVQPCPYCCCKGRSISTACASVNHNLEHWFFFLVGCSAYILARDQYLFRCRYRLGFFCWLLCIYFGLVINTCLGVGIALVFFCWLLCIYLGLWSILV